MRISKILAVLLLAFGVMFVAACGGGAKGDGIALTNKMTDHVNAQVKLMKDGKYDEAAKKADDAKMKEFADEAKKLEEKYKLSKEEEKKLSEDADVKAANDKLAAAMKAYGEEMAKEMAKQIGATK